MGESWRNGYDAWKLRERDEETEELTEEEQRERDEAEARAESIAEDWYMEEHFERKYGGKT